MHNFKTFDEFLGRDVAYSVEKTKIYQMLSGDENSLFRDETLAKIFFYAAILGFEKERSIKLKKRKPTIRITAFSNKQKAVLIALVIANTKGIDVLLGKTRPLTIIEEHANWGINELESLVIEGGHNSDDYLLTLKNVIRHWNVQPPPNI